MTDLDKQIIDALIADLREMDAHEAINLDAWKAAADFIERFADDEPVQRKIGRRLSNDELDQIRLWTRTAFEDDGNTDAAHVANALFGHIDAIEHDLASCRAGQPRHKEQT